MKLILILTMLTLAFNAFASWSYESCSSSDGSVTWKTDSGEGEIHLKYSNFIEGVLTLDIKKVRTQFGKNILISKRQHKSCSEQYEREVYAGRVLISPGQDDPYVLQNYFPLNRILSEVICTKITYQTKKCEKK